VEAPKIGGCIFPLVNENVQNKAIAHVIKRKSMPHGI